MFGVSQDGLHHDGDFGVWTNTVSRGGQIKQEVASSTTGFELDRIHGMCHILELGSTWRQRQAPYI
jgi:hypothetical protein